MLEDRPVKQTLVDGLSMLDGYFGPTALYGRPINCGCGELRFKLDLFWNVKYLTPIGEVGKAGQELYLALEAIWWVTASA
jgi:hypothetical protein